MAAPIVSVNAQIEDSDPGYRQFIAKITDPATHVDIGVHPVSGEEMVMIASVNEFGAFTGKNHDIILPARPYIRSTVDENRDKYVEVAKRRWAAVLDGRETIGKALSLMGLLIESDIRRKIISLKEPINAPSTIRRKGSDNPLIDTGMLLNSIRYAVKSKDDDVLELSPEGTAQYKGGKKAKK